MALPRRPRDRPALITYELWADGADQLCERGSTRACLEIASRAEPDVATDLYRAASAAADDAFHADPWIRWSRDHGPSTP